MISVNKKPFIASMSLLLTLGSFPFVITQVMAASSAPMMNDAPPVAKSAPPVPPSGDGMGPMSVSPTGMMGGAPGMMASPSATNMDQEDITLGQNLYLKFKNSQTSCQDFSSGDFEKMGAYMLNQQLGNATYAQMGQMIQDPEKQQINIAAGKSATNCTTASITPVPTQPMEDNTKTMADSSEKTDSLMMGLGIGSMVAILLNVLLTIILLSKIGKTGSKNAGSGPKSPAPSTPSTSSGPMTTPKPSMPQTHPASSSLFPSGVPTPPTQPSHIPAPSTGSMSSTPPSHVPMPVAHTSMPPMPDHTIPPQPQQSHDMPPKPPLFS